MVTRRGALTLLAFGLAPTALRAAEEGKRLKVVATFSILADFVRQVGGEGIDLATLVGPDGDAHVYSPTPADARRIAEARVVFVNGLGLEGWIGRLVRSSGTKAVVVEAARGIRPLESRPERGHGAHRHESGHAHGTVDPHAWQDVDNARAYVRAVRDGLAAADPAGRALYEGRAAAYLERLDALEAEARALLERIPPERRRVITSHDSFGYFERAYGLAFVAPQGVSTEAEASARDVARIIQQIRRERIAAVFLENVSDPRLMERIARETGARIGGRLYSDALSPEGGPAATYIDMMRHNIRAFGAALTP